MNDFFQTVDDKGYLSLSAHLPELAGKRVRVTVEKSKSKRSEPQNRFFHGVVVQVVQKGLKDLGHQLDKEEVKLFLKERFLKDILSNEDQEFLGYRIKNTSALTKSEFADFIAQIQQFCAEYLNVVLDDPGEQSQIKI